MPAVQAIMLKQHSELKERNFKKALVLFKKKKVKVCQKLHILYTIKFSISHQQIPMTTELSLQNCLNTLPLNDFSF